MCYTSCPFFVVFLQHRVFEIHYALHRSLESGRNCDSFESENSLESFWEHFCFADLNDGKEVSLNQGKSRQSVRV